MTRRLKSSFAFRIPKFQDGGTKYDETIGTYALPNVTIRAKRPQWVVHHNKTATTIKTN